jgi:subtilisin family serine protease
MSDFMIEGKANSLPLSLTRSQFMQPQQVSKLFVGLLSIGLALGAMTLSAQERQKPNSTYAPSALKEIADQAHLESLLKDNPEFAMVRDGDKVYGAWNVQFKTALDCENFDVPGVTIITRFDRFADVFLPANRETFEKVAQSPGLEWIELNRKYVIPPLPRPVPSKESSKQIPDPIVKGELEKLTGKGVIIAVVDSGIDFRHQDFITYDAEGQPVSRILAFWDTTSEMTPGEMGKEAPVKYPSGDSIGIIYSRDDLTKDLRTLPNEIPGWDSNGHGTACAGVAAGNGNASKQKYQGVAPGADIVAVRIGGSSEGGLENSYLIGAICDWLETIAEGRPFVVSCSYGGQLGNREGDSIEERQISARFAPDRESRAICIAAGNEGNLRIHAAVKVGDLDHAAKDTSVDPDEDGVRLFLYVKTDDLEDIEITEGRGSQFRVLEKYVYGPSQAAVFEVVAVGADGIHVFSKKGKPCAADAYIEGGVFPDGVVSYEKLVGTPGGADNAITVGSYDWNDNFHYRGRLVEVLDLDRRRPLEIGGRSTYSSAGFVRQGRVKPEIVAPGQWFTAPLSSNAPTARIESSGQYAIFNGTSAATPYTAGIIALLFEKNPHLTVGELKKLLQTCATTEGLIPAKVPNSEWGYGKLDRKAALRMVRELKAPAAE